MKFSIPGGKPEYRAGSLGTAYESGHKIFFLLFAVLIKQLINGAPE
jgi:hypothetical protein